MVQVRVGLTHKNPSRVMGQPVFASSQKNRVRVGSGQKILTHFAMSTKYCIVLK